MLDKQRTQYTSYRHIRQAIEILASIPLPRVSIPHSRVSIPHSRVSIPHSRVSIPHSRVSCCIATLISIPHITRYAKNFSLKKPFTLYLSLASIMRYT